MLHYFQKQPTCQLLLRDILRYTILPVRQLNRRYKRRNGQANKAVYRVGLENKSRVFTVAGQDGAGFWIHCELRKERELSRG